MTKNTRCQCRIKKKKSISVQCLLIQNNKSRDLLGWRSHVGPNGCETGMSTVHCAQLGVL